VKLKVQDLKLFNLVFEHEPGWILDFSNSSLSAFFEEELDINIDDERYQAEGKSKARRVRCLLKQVDRDTVLRVLAALWQHKMESTPEQAEQRRQDYHALISRLEKADAGAASGTRPARLWHGVDWPELTAEMDAMKILAPYPMPLRYRSLHCPPGRYP